MTTTTGVRSLGRRTIAALVAVALAVGLMVVGADRASASPHRESLRPDANGTCEWDAHQFWVQRCDVWSEATGHNITVQIQPAKNGGNAGFYLLDGLRATNHANAWTVDHSAPATYVNDNITLVMPVGGAGSFYSDWEGPATYDLNNPVNYQWETFLTQELPVYLQENFGVHPQNNSIAGLSMGGTAALNLAARNPEMFRQTMSWSGYLTMTLPGMQTMLRVALLDAGGFNLNAMYGSIISPKRFANDPFLNMGNLHGMEDIYVSAATGIPGPQDANYPPNLTASGMPLEMFSRLTTTAWAAKAHAEGLNFTEDYPATGIHNWTNFGNQLDKTRGRVLDVMNAHGW